MSKILVCVMVLCTLLLAACGGGAATPAPTVSPYDEKAPITVWVDTTRLAGAELYKELHPDVANLITIEVVDRGQFPAKVLLFNNTGSGWPDVVFAEPFPLVSAVADAAHHYPLDLRDWVSKEILDGFAPGALEPCTFDGKLYCLRNDLAQVVLWYDAKMMADFGYEVPKTWEEYEALGAQVAQEHPGLIVGTCGDDQCYTAYFQGSRCPIGQVRSMSQVYINTQDAKCMRAAEMVDRMIANESIATLSPFDPAFVELAKTGKLLMLPAASWYGEYIFGGKPDSLYYQTAEGQLGVALPLRWKDEDKPYTGFHGGAAWTVSNHTPNPKLAVDVAVFMAAGHEYQDTAVTFPAWLPAADKWAGTVAGNAVYAFDPYPVLKEAAGMMTIEGLGPVRYDWQTPWTTDIVGALLKGETIVSALPTVQATYKGLAEAQGYEVIINP
jgi:multiple sugar transport system substrate-binding protein